MGARPTAATELVLFSPSSAFGFGTVPHSLHLPLLLHTTTPAPWRRRQQIPGFSPRDGCNRLHDTRQPRHDHEHRSCTPQTMIESRLRSALWGMFGGDALAAPSHWYYGGFSQIQADYGPNGLTGYTKPVTTLRGSILNKSDPNGGGRLSYGNKRGRTYRSSGT